jgi:ribosomal protein S13
LFKFKETILPFNRTLFNSLKEIYGIGFERALYISSLFGFSSINRLNYYYFESIVALLKSEYILEDRLKFIIKNRFNLFRDVSLVRVKRYDLGLPTHGQRTHSNGKTIRRNRLF